MYVHLSHILYLHRISLEETITLEEVSRGSSSDSHKRDKDVLYDLRFTTCNIGGFILQARGRAPREDILMAAHLWIAAAWVSMLRIQISLQDVLLQSLIDLQLA